MTEYAWPAWALTTNERCQEHHDPGCPYCYQPLDENDYRIDNPTEIEAAQNRYEAHMGWGRNTA